MNRPEQQPIIRASERGFTLVELIAVVILIALMFTVVASGIFSSSDAAKARVNGIRMEKLRGALSQYRLEYNRYPAQLQDLVKGSPEVAKSGRPFFALIGEEELLDVWGGNFNYRTEGDNRSYSLTSLGSDGKSGGSGAEQDVTVGP